MIGDKQELIMTLIILPNLAGIWSIFRSVTYVLFVKQYWGEEKFYSDQSFAEARRFFVGIKCCPHPNLTEKQREQWASGWWVYMLVGLAIIISTLYAYEIYLK